LEYRHLLDEALATSDPAERMVLIAAFIASGYSATLSRESKPFNPLLGETFEWQSGDQSCRFLCEQVPPRPLFPPTPPTLSGPNAPFCQAVLHGMQSTAIVLPCTSVTMLTTLRSFIETNNPIDHFMQVSHHPPVSCWWSEGSAGWQYWGEIELRSKFWGKSVEMMPTGFTSPPPPSPAALVIILPSLCQLCTSAISPNVVGRMTTERKVAVSNPVFDKFSACTLLAVVGFLGSSEGIAGC